MLNLNYRSFFFIFFLSIFLFIFKWFLSFYFFDEDIILRIIHDSELDSSLYFHYVKALSDFDFNNIYHPTKEGLKYMPIPYGSIFLHTLLYKFSNFGVGYILIELLCIFLFLLIFYSIFILLNFNKLFSLLLATLLFCSPSIAVLTKLDSIPEIYTFAQHFYNLRFPRPLVANIYLYLFIYLIIFINEEKVFNKKNGLYLGVIMGLSFSSFFNIFIFQAIALSFLLFCNFKKKIIYNLFKNYEFILYISFSFLFIATPFLLLINNAEPNYMERVQVININLEQKIFLLNHYLEKLVRIKMIIFYAFLALIFILINKRKEYPGKKIIIIFYLNFITSIVSPLIFIIISNKIAFLYHFNNLVVINAVLLVFILFFNQLNIFIKSIKSKNIVNTLFFILIIFLIGIFNYDQYLKFHLHHRGGAISYDSYESRKEKNEIIKILKKNNIDIKTSNLLTFDYYFITWAIMKNIKHLTITSGIYTPRKNDTLENDLITTFKFLNLDKNMFLSFLETKKVGYRYMNQDTAQIFWGRYQANSLHTFNNSLNYDDKIKEFIMNTSPFYSHQYVIPNDEIERFKSKFDQINLENFSNPDIIIINKNHRILKFSQVNKNFYCEKFNKNNFILLLKKEKTNC